VRIVLKNSLTGLYYAGNQAWSADVSGAMEFDSCKAAAALALAEKLETVDVVLRYENPTCELKLPLAACVSDAARATANGRHRPRAP
jgi:hypothetical protein